MSERVKTKQAAKFLAVSETRLRQLALQGRLKAKKSDRDWTFPVDELVKYSLTRKPGRPRKETRS